MRLGCWIGRKYHTNWFLMKSNENNLAATHVAEQLGENIEQVFKTLVLRGDKHGIFVCVIPGDKEVDLKKGCQNIGK